MFPLSSMLSKDSQTSLLLLVAPAAAAAAAPSSAPAWRLAPERAAGAHASQVREERERERDTRSSLDKESSRFCEENPCPTARHLADIFDSIFSLSASHSRPRRDLFFPLRFFLLML